MNRRLLAASLTLALFASPALAQHAGPPAGGPPPGASKPASKDPAAAPAGVYTLDPRHASIIARISHANGFSYSTFRFSPAGGTLDWNPTNIEASKVDVAIDMTSVANPVEGFAKELQGPNFLNAVEFGQARFVSTRVRKTGENRGEITGDMTFRGKTAPVTISAELLGAGKNFMGRTVVGFTGVLRFKRSDFGYGAGAPIIGDDVEVLIDVEFGK